MTMLKTPGRMLLLAVMVLLAYRGATENGFHFDDIQNIVRYRPIQVVTPGLDAFLNAAVNGYLPRRIIPNLTFALDWWRGQGAAGAFLQTNLVIHVLNACLVLLLCGRIFRLVRPHEGGRTGLVALVCASLWAVHPQQTQAVLLIVQRMTLLASTFTLLTLIAFLAARCATRSGARAAGYTVAFCCFLLAAVSKENAWILPVLILLAEYGIVRNGGRLIRRGSDLVLLALPAVVILSAGVDLLTGWGPLSSFITPGYDARDFTLGERLLTQTRVFFFYLYQYFVPLPGTFSIEHDLAISRSLLDPPQTLLSCSGLTAWMLVGTGMLFKRDGRITGFFLLWIPATLAIESSVIPLEMVFEHRMYLPSFGIAGFIGLGLLKLPPFQRSTGLAIFFTIVFISLIVLMHFTSIRVPVWRDDHTLYSDALVHAPGSARVWNNLGFHHLTTGLPDLAERELLTALSLDPGHPAALENLGLLRLEQGRLGEAQELLQRAVQANKGQATPGVLSHLGEVEMARGNPDLAGKYFNQARMLEPWDPVNYWNLALALEQNGECRAAFGHWNRFVELTESETDRAEVQEHLKEKYSNDVQRCGK